MNDRSMHKALTAFAVALFYLAGCRPAGQPTPTPEPSAAPPTSIPSTDTPLPLPTAAFALTPTLEPQAVVVRAWHAAWNAKDLEAFMALLADDAVLDRGPYGVITGTEAIRAVVMEEMEEGLKARLSNIRVVGDRVYCHYEVLLDNKVIDEGESVTIVRDGKIVSDLPAR